MKNKRLQIPVVETTSYYEALTRSLIAFAEENPSFKSFLITRLRTIQTIDVPMQNDDNKMSTSVSSIFALRSEELAIRRTEWLLQLTTQALYTSAIIQPLMSWSRSQEKTNPGFIVLGLKAGIINYGIFGHPSKRNEPIDIIVREDIAQNITPRELAQISVTLTSSVVEKGLISASGNSKLLEPELADWLFGEKNVVLHKGALQTILNIKDVLFKVDAPYVFRADKKGVTYLAINPSLYIHNLAEADLLETLE
jgi:hypothetical protein